jgi:hypothetical protein
MNAYPRMFRVRQSFPRQRVTDVAACVESELARLPLADRVRPGQTVAMTAGSRGIANMPAILRAAAAHFRALGAEPFIVPAMGSHGGATAAGQQQLLASYGITAESCGCPIRSSMETVVVCQAPEGFPVHFDHLAYQADHVLVVGRVKPHTRFTGPVESGLMKMLLIGLGKHAGALVYHRAIQDFSFGQILRGVAREVIERCRIVAGLAIVENAYDETACIRAVAPHEFEQRESELLIQARQWLPRLPFNTADLLLVDEIGKDISGAGLDTNVVGRKYLDHVAREDEVPKIKYLAVRGLTAASRGNATGIGLVEFCRSQILRDMDVQATRTNCLTGSHPTAATLPLDYETDRELLDTVFSVLGLRPPAASRLMWIRHTLDVVEVECAETYLADATGRPDLTVVTEPRELPFDNQGNLPWLRNWS